MEGLRSSDDRSGRTSAPSVLPLALLELKVAAQADEIVVGTPSLDRARRADSFTAIADGPAQRGLTVEPSVWALPLQRGIGLEATYE